MTDPTVERSPMYKAAARLFRPARPDVPASSIPQPGPVTANPETESEMEAPAMKKRSRIPLIQKNHADDQRSMFGRLLAHENNTRRPFDFPSGKPWSPSRSRMGHTRNGTRRGKGYPKG